MLIKSKLLGIWSLFLLVSSSGKQPKGRQNWSPIGCMLSCDQLFYFYLLHLTANLFLICLIVGFKKGYQPVFHISSSWVKIKPASQVAWKCLKSSCCGWMGGPTHYQVKLQLMLRLCWAVTICKYHQHINNNFQTYHPSVFSSSNIYLSLKLYINDLCWSLIRNRTYSLC